MKKLTAILTLALGLTQFASAQVTTVDCDMMNLVVNVSDTGLVKLYHPGHYLTHPQSENVIEWEVTDAAGNVIAQETLIDDSDFLFDFNTPLTEIMNVSAHLTNDSAIHNGFPVNCLIEDQLFWEVTEIIPGYISGRWEFLHGNVGVDQNEVSGIFDVAPAAIEVGAADGCCNACHPSAPSESFAPSRRRTGTISCRRAVRAVA